MTKFQKILPHQMFRNFVTSLAEYGPYLRVWSCLNSLNIKYHPFCRKGRVKTQMELLIVMVQKIWEAWVLKLKKCALTPPSSMALCSYFFLVYLSSLGTALVFRQDYSSESKQSFPQARQKMNSIQMEAIDIASNAMILNIWGIG